MTADGSAKYISVFPRQEYVYLVFGLWKFGDLMSGFQCTINPKEIYNFILEALSIYANFVFSLRSTVYIYVEC